MPAAILTITKNVIYSLGVLGVLAVVFLVIDFYTASTS